MKSHSGGSSSSFNFVMVLLRGSSDAIPRFYATTELRRSPEIRGEATARRFGGPRLRHSVHLDFVPHTFTSVTLFFYVKGLRFTGHEG